MTLAILLHASATTAQYLLTVTEHRPTPILSASNPPGQGMAPMDCIVFNPSYIPSSGSFNQTGLLVRMCCGKQCIGHGRRIAHRTELSSAAPEQIGFAPCNLETGVCGDVYPSETFNLDPSSDSEDPRAFYYPETQNYYNFYYRQVNLPVGKQRCPEKNPRCHVRLARTRTPLNASSWVPIGTYPWHRNGCCAMRPKGERSYCIWGEGPDPFPGLGVSYTTDIDSGVFTRASWSAAPGVDSPLSSDRQWLLPLGAAQEEIKWGPGGDNQAPPLSKMTRLHAFLRRVRLTSCFPVLFAVLPGEHPAREVTIRFGRTVIGLACNHVTSVTSAHGRPRAALVRGSTYMLQYWLACVGLGEPWW